MRDMQNSPRKLLVVDDDPKLRDLLHRYLTEQQFEVALAPDGGAMNRLLQKERFDLVILDLMLPGEDGLSIVRRLRGANDRTPVIMLTAKGDDVDRIVGLEMGADDYLPKPFEPRELLARLKSILRRARTEVRANVLRFGRLEIDAGAREVRLDDAPQRLTSHQFELLLVLAQHAGRVMSREAIMNLLKHENLEAFDRSIDVHISRIRAAIEDDAKRPRRIITVRGAGYVFAKAQD
jgi:two-component system, OmpR family, phosphate regulon response regulator OmpR